MHLALKSAMSRIPYTNKVGETLGSIADSAAAYSLRALGGGDPMVVRVRRSSDDAEKDFTASDMGAALEYWVGSGNDGHVVTWYDQSGNGNNATQSTAGSQPKIVDAGVYLGELEFDGVDDRLTGAHNITSTYTICSVQDDDASSGSYILDTGPASNYGVNYGRTTGSQGSRILTLNHGGSPAVNAIGFLPSTTFLLTQTYNSTTIEAYVDGGSVGTDDQGYIASGTNLTIGSSGDGGARFNGSISEIVIYNSDQSSNRAAIETNINNHYDIY